ALQHTGVTDEAAVDFPSPLALHDALPISLDATNGLATAWNPGANGPVSALAVSGSTVYAGGDFTSAGGQPRTDIAALDAATGLATAWHPAANRPLSPLAVSRPPGQPQGRL